ncbi:hypothetical protein IT400_01070 [Candidatus Nomurabacteria bacterium]|nr:hypothetical protein [Candidatus Nomurabacteria bacterium]
MEAQTKNCQNCKQDFIIESEDFNFYEKIKVPTPTFCPDCRLQRRMSWRNERSLHKMKCCVPGHNEDIITMYDPEKPYIVYDNKYWWSDEWDPCDYGAEYDFSKSFFIQFSDLSHKVPQAALSTLNSINSEYTNYVDGNKNCYLIFGSGWNENIRYGNKLFSCKDSQDLLNCTKCELSYECESCAESHRLFYSRNSKNCTDSYLLYNCRNCMNCFGCSNLVSKSYCIWNKQYEKQGYFDELERLGIKSYKNLISLKEKFINEVYLSSIHRYANILNSTDCTGNNIIHSKNCKNCYDIWQNAEDSKYLYASLDIKDSYDGIGVFKNELSYENVDCNIGSKNFATIVVYDSNNIEYSINCHNCKYCFGCTGIRNKQYCILNKQYTKEEYIELLPKIKEHMGLLPYIDKVGRVYKYGEFFPVDLSCFGYNETIAQEYFPLTFDENLKFGFTWKKNIERNYKIDIKATDLPDSINDINLLLNKTIECEHFQDKTHDCDCEFACTEAYKITEEDISFHNRLKIPLPRMCPNCRHYSRLKQRTPLKLWHRTCMCDKENHEHIGVCTNEFETSYSPERPEIIYCEKCYQAEVM